MSNARAVFAVSRFQYDPERHPEHMANAYTVYVGNIHIGYVYRFYNRGPKDGLIRLWCYIDGGYETGKHSGYYRTRRSAVDELVSTYQGMQSNDAEVR